jgi:hypothetical protein
MPEFSNLSRLLITVGLGLAVLGLVIGALARFGLPLGRLPGDLRFKIGSVSCMIPLASMLVLSLLLTLAINLALRFLNK